MAIRRFWKKLLAEGVDVLTDPERNSYQAASFERGYTETFFSVRSVARAEGHRIIRPRQLSS